jgi:hypothetical protein
MILAATLVTLTVVLLVMATITVRNDPPLWVYLLVALAAHPLGRLLTHDTALGGLTSAPVLDWAVSLSLAATGTAIISVLLGLYRKRYGARGPRAQQAGDREPDMAS